MARQTFLPRRWRGTERFVPTCAELIIDWRTPARPNHGWYCGPRGAGHVMAAASAGAVDKRPRETLCLTQ